MISTTDFYFQNFAEWRQAITERCNIELTPEYASSRVAALKNSKDKSTQEFKAKYGEDYLKQVIEWFEQAERDA